MIRVCSFSPHLNFGATRYASINLSGKLLPPQQKSQRNYSCARARSAATPKLTVEEPPLPVYPLVKGRPGWHRSKGEEQEHTQNARGYWLGGRHFPSGTSIRYVIGFGLRSGQVRAQSRSKRVERLICRSNQTIPYMQSFKASCLIGANVSNPSSISLGRLLFQA